MHVCDRQTDRHCMVLAEYGTMHMRHTIKRYLCLCVCLCVCVCVYVCVCLCVCMCVCVWLQLAVSSSTDVDNSQVTVSASLVSEVHCSIQTFDAQSLQLFHL